MKGPRQKLEVDIVDEMGDREQRDMMCVTARDTSVTATKWPFQLRLRLSQDGVCALSMDLKDENGSTPRQRDETMVDWCRCVVVSLRLCQPTDSLSGQVSAFKLLGASKHATSSSLALQALFDSTLSSPPGSQGRSPSRSPGVVPFNVANMPLLGLLCGIVLCLRSPSSGSASSMRLSHWHLDHALAV